MLINLSANQIEILNLINQGYKYSLDIYKHSKRMFQAGVYVDISILREKGLVERLSECKRYNSNKDIIRYVFLLTEKGKEYLDNLNLKE